MLACKVVAGGEQIKKINEQLKAGKENEPQKSKDSFKSATKGEETVSSETEQVISRPKITSEVISEVTVNLKNRFILVGTVDEIETTESGKIGVWSEESAREEEESEPLEDLLRKVSDSYNPKKKKDLGVKVPGTARENKKRNAASSIPVDTPPTRGSTTRSQKKHSEAELEKALEESKRKAAAKGKKKVVEPVEAVEIEEMDLVLRDEEETEEIEVVTLKAKKSVSKTKSPSTLAKRTRSALKSRKVKVVEEEEGSEEE
uniref:Uncharacterized protein n=1 Tax=Nicotiana tabacum TaxID=4097 RepID=A0A1S3YE99_TOBAC|nr:PREDICTED: uncharacterized protein LOC107775152 [Nicotiana tabacum]